MTRRQVPIGQYPIDTNASASEPLNDEQLEAITGGSFLDHIKCMLNPTAQISSTTQISSTVQTTEGGGFVSTNASTFVLQ